MSRKVRSLQHGIKRQPARVASCRSVCFPMTPPLKLSHHRALPAIAHLSLYRGAQAAAWAAGVDSSAWQETVSESNVRNISEQTTKLNKTSTCNDLHNRHTLRCSPRMTGCNNITSKRRRLRLITLLRYHDRNCSTYQHGFLVPNKAFVHRLRELRGPAWNNTA
mgnify:CR=1 FL=1